MAYTIYKSYQIYKKPAIISAAILLGVSAAVFGLVLFGDYLKKDKNLYTFDAPQKYGNEFEISAFNYVFKIKPLKAQSVVLSSQGDVIKYESAYENTDVVQTKFSDKLKEDIILKKPGHPEEFQYQIDMTDFDFKKESSGDIYFYEKGNEQKIIFILPAPFMIDSRGKESSPQEVAVSLTGQGLLTIKPNAEWLKNAVYPVALDPTIEINILNVHSHPQTGENWEVDFTTLGQADLKIAPNDQATIDDDEFVSLFCGNQNIQPQILPDDVIFVENWECAETAKVIHYTKKAGQHTLKFEFGGQIVYAYNTSTWYNSSWAYRQAITLQGTKIATTTSAFPILASTTQAVLKTTTNGGKVGHDSGYDIVFTDSDGTTLLDYEREKYASTTGEIAYWIETSIASSTNKTIYMYYGNAAASDLATTTGVWDANFKGVWHLKETDIDGGAGDIKDSTSNINNGTTNSMTVADQIAGQIDGSFDLDGSSDFINVGSSAALAMTGNLTISSWIKMPAQSAAPNLHCMIFGGYNTGSPWTGYGFGPGCGGSSVGQLQFWSNTHGSWVAGNSRVDDNVWHHVVISLSGTTATFYKDGVADGAPTSAAPGAYAGGRYIGTVNASTDANHTFIGVIDEVRVSNVARSAGWIATEYNNQSNMATFMNFGTEESGVLEQEGFRWRNDDGNETTATWLANQDTNITSDNNTNLRLRILINGVSDPASTQYQLEYKKMGENTFRKVLTSSDTDQIIMAASPNISVSGDNTTAQLTAPSGKTTGNFVTGRMQDDENPADAVDITANNYTELEWSIKATDKAFNYSIYQFRVTSNGTAFDTYSITPQLTIFGTPRTVIDASQQGRWTNGLIGYWSLDGDDIAWNSQTAYDRSGTSPANNGTITNMSTSTSPKIGKVGQALNFDGSDDTITAGDIAAVDSATALTGCAWVNHNTITTDDIIMAKNNASTDGFQFFRDDVGASSARTDTYTISVFDSADADSASVEGATGKSVANTWTFVCFVFTANSASGLKLYTNAVVDDTIGNTSGINAIDAGANVFRIGTLSDGSTNPFDGIIDEVRVYNRALTQSEITDLYNIGTRRAKFKL